jgi:hypothetical protein
MKGTESMIVIALILGCIIWTALSTPAGGRTTPSDDTRQDRFSREQSGKRKGGGEPVDPANEEQSSWTALDDMQVARLLRDSAP